MVPRLQEKYRNEIVPEMMKRFEVHNPMAVPRLVKVVVNMGVGEALQDIKILEKAAGELGLITGQKPVIRRAKKAIANFKIREGNPVGCKVTLRRARMYEFVDRLLNVALPRIRDFRGVSRTAFDEAGNYTMGLSEQAIFPEIDYDKITRTQGMDITFVIANASSDDQAREFLRLLGMPFEKEEDR
ncbi:MAG: 50S ribosomal protein L5 [Candidatus Omnitrophica bacterium]|nr:50S ribosomal protein L5 [Candidatus Omnitrophota bacterium]